MILFVLLGVSTSSKNVESHREFQILRHNVNNIEMCISNYGKFGQDETGSHSGCWWPIGTNHRYIYGAGLWFASVDSLTGDTLVTVGYNPYSGESEFAPGLAGWPVTHPAAIIYIHPENWPAPPDTLPMAPQDTISHEDSWCCFNDYDSIYHVPGDTRPIGIEVYQTVYAWDYWFVEDVIFFMYDVKNVSDHTLHDCYFGVCIDCDIGSITGADDRCSGIVEHEYILMGDTIVVDDIAYQWQEQEEPGVPPWWPGTTGFDLLQTPFDLVEGMDKDGDGILDQYERDSAYYVSNLPSSLWDVDNDGVPDWRDPSQWPQIGMTALKQFTLQFDPNIDAERYATMAGYNFLTGVYEPYDTIPPMPDDWRFLVASGPFSLAPDSIVTLVFAVMFADWHDIYQTPDSALALVDKWAQHFYDMYWFTYTGAEENFEFRISDCEMKITPNPISHKGTVSFSLPATDHVSLKLYNIAGQLVDELIDARVDAGRHTMSIDTCRLPQGTYFVILETACAIETRLITVVR
jgi:hypothetical protein